MSDDPVNDDPVNKSPANDSPVQDSPVPKISVTRIPVAASAVDDGAAGNSAVSEPVAKPALTGPGIARTLGWSELADQAAIEQEPLRARGMLYGIGVVVVLLIGWSAFAEIDTVTRGQGKVIPSQQVQVIGSQDGGVVREILVREGNTVPAGALLLRLDQTRSQSTLGENRVELRSLSVKAARLRAVIDQQPFEPTALMLAEVPDIVEQERQLFASTLSRLEVEQQITEQQLLQRSEEMRELQARETQLDTEQRLTARELDVTRPMVSSGAVSQVEILRLERDLNRASGELAQTRAQVKRIASSIVEARERVSSVRLDFINEAGEQLTETTTRINGLREAAEGLSDRVRQTNVTAPVAGTIKQLFFNTVGGVVLPGRDIIELVPLDDTLLLEVRVRPQDIAFIAPGQGANVKVTAYDFVVYGGLPGEVEQISADTVVDEEGDAFYEVRVRTDRANLGAERPIIPGMTVEVDIITGKKTVLAYLMKPVLRAHQRAFSER
jgi:adhesin transport system membrane fusion protein